MSGPLVEIGESFVGEGAEAAHVNTVLGHRVGPVGTAWATALATPSTGHAPFVCVLRPGLPVQPPTLFVNKAAVAGERHGTLTWGAAQAGVATGVRDFVLGGDDADPSGASVRLSDGGMHRCDELVLICAVWVDPAADDEQLVFANNAAATTAALEVGARRRALPSTSGVDAANPFFFGGAGTKDS